MKNKNYGWLTVVLLVSHVSLAKEPEKKPSGWSTKMHQMAQALSEILVDASSVERFTAPKNAKRIEANSKKLADLAHDIAKATQGAKSDVISPDGDVSLGIISGLFKEESNRAYQEIKRGNKVFARSIIRSIPSYCMGCHTRGSGGPEFGELLTDAQIKGLSEYEKAEAYASARQYDKALTQFESVIKNAKFSRERIVEWERATRYAVAISVRVKKDPKKAIAITEEVLGSKASPKYFRDDVELWKESLVAWEKEFSKTPTSEEGLFVEGQRLMSLALSTQKYSSDRGSEVIYLRATQVFHELLKSYPKGGKTSESLYMLGLAYRALQDLNLWSLSDLYFEACIRQSPKTEVASQCFKQYEESVFIGYSGSGGVSIPSDVRAKVLELDSLANGLRVEKAQ
ncbi:MAG: tetratricopeptide repeat protein [Xanthomonadaceae bacterium]|nr:tetratricopeptide repeat protein [Xanthomonadaceae bacterium]